jgi:hypothetical protein
MRIPDVRSSQYCIAIKNVFIISFIDPKSIEQNTFIHQNIFTPQLSLLEPNTEADIDIIARCIINIDFISQNSLQRGGDG